MKKKNQKSREELHLDFIKSIDKSLNRAKVFKYVKHDPVDEELDRVRENELAINDLFKYKKHIGKVKEIQGSLISAIDVRTKEEFICLAYLVERL